jgi:asparagine synthetase B (glutamine-hydrolysing)
VSCSVRVLVADPATAIVDGPTGRWFVSGVKQDELCTVVRETTDVDTIRERLVDVAEDAAVIHVGNEAVHAYRTVVGSHRLYYLHASDGDFVVTDHFRNALAHLDVADRTVSDRAIVDHLLFRAPHPPTTFIDEIRAVEQGVWFSWNRDTETATSRLVDSLSTGDCRATHRTADAVVDALDETLDSLLQRAVDMDAESTYNLFSGGVDSTLVQSYLDGVPMLNVGIDSPEYQFEVDYATEHSDRFDTTFTRSTLSESNLLSHLERTVDALGTPSMPLMTPLMNRAFEMGTDRTYVMSVGADVLCGSKGTKAARYASLFAPVLVSPLGAFLGGVPGEVGTRLQWLRTVARQQQYDPVHPESFPQQFAAYMKPELVTSLFGRELVAERCRKQVEYARERVETNAPEGFPTHVEMAHLLALFGHRSGSRWRQLATTHGNTLVMPFQTRSITRQTLSMPASHRYVSVSGCRRLLSKKHLLKDLLDRRLPSYPCDQPKGSGVLPFERYFRDGCFADVFEQYDVPSFVPREKYATAIEESGPQAWNVVTYAIWRDRVLTDPDLATTAHTRTYTL